MLYVNDELLRLTDKNNPYVAEYLQAKEQLEKKYKFPLIFKDKFGRRRNPTGAIEPAKIVSIPLTEAVDTPDGRIYWKYSASLGKAAKKRLMFKDILKVDRKDIELAFFLMYKSSAVKTAQIRLVDLKSDAEKQVKAKQKMIKTRFYLYEDSPVNPLFDDEDKLRTIAMAFGVAYANNKEYTLDQVKLQLENIIEGAEVSGDDTRNEAAFVKAIDLNEIIRQKASIQEAIDKKLLDYLPNKGGWYMLDKQGQAREKILTIPIAEEDNRFEHLVKLLIRDEFYRDMVEKSLGKEGVFNKGDITLSDLNKMEYKVLQKFAADKGIPVIGKAKEDIIFALRSKLDL